MHWSYKHSLPTTQEMRLHMDVTRCSVLKSDWSYSLQLKMEKLYTGTKKIKRLGTDCGSDHELLIEKFIFKLKKAGKTRPFKYDPHQIPYDYTVKGQIDLRD